jgi:hypothetical protein
MMLKVNNEFLDFNADIELDRKVKLFEDVAESEGDVSFEFELYLTGPNKRILNFPFPDNSSKIVYHKVPAELLNNQGFSIRLGVIRIERKVNNTLFCSFFSGNQNWFDLLSGPLSDVDFSDLETSQTEANIIASKGNTSGVTWPIVDNGALVTRSYRNMMVEDFVPGLYVHTVISRIFRKYSIKLQGELFTNPIYKLITTHKDAKSKTDIEDNTSYVQKSSTTARPVELDDYKVTFDNDSVYPYYDGDADSFDLTNSRYVAPYKMKVKVEASFVPSIIDSSYNNRIYLYINGVFTFVDIGLDAGGLYNSATAGNVSPFTLERTITLEAGDVLEWYSEWQQSGGSTQNDIVSGFVKVTPIFIYFLSADSLLPEWTQREYVSNIFRLFNTITSYDSVTKTLTVNLFDKLKQKEPIDLSPYINSVETDFTEFISNYGKKNLFSYDEVDFDDLRDYNVRTFFKYGQGSIDVDNEFLEDTADVIESDFSNPIGYLHPVFDMSMERLNIIELDQDETVNFTAVNDSSGQAVFTIDKDIFLVGDLVRVSDSTNPYYNGDWVVDFRTPGSPGSIELRGVEFDDTATTVTGKITKLIHSYNNSDDVYLMVNVPNYLLTKFSGNSNMYIGDTLVTSHSVAYFNLLNTGRQINTDFKQSLSFGEISSQFFYQRTMLQTFWQSFQNIVNDPVKLKTVCYLPYVVYESIDFLRPIFIKTEESSNLYYCNRIYGYKTSYNPCEVELIKLP